MNMTQSQFKQLVQDVALFRNVSTEDIAKIFAKGMTMRLEKGQVLFYQNTAGDTMYIIMLGTVHLYDGKKNIATLKSGDMLGEMALISDEPRSATAVAAEDTSLFVLTESTFHNLLTKRVAVQMLLNIIGTLCHRLREANKRLTSH